MGNVRRTVNTHKDLGTSGQGYATSSTEDYWYRYDAMNRLVLDKGVLSGTAGASGTIIVRRVAEYAQGNTGIGIVYDAAGQRIATTQLTHTPYVLTGYWDYVNNVPVYTGFTPGYSQKVRENYEYDGAGRIAAIRIAKGAQELDVFDPVAGTFSPSPTAPAAAPSSGGTQRSLFTYDLMGRQLTQSDYDDAGTSVVYGRSASYDLAGKLTSDSSTTVRSGATYVTSTSYGYTDLSSGEYLLGAMGSTTSNTWRNGSWQYTSGNSYAYAWWNGAVQSGITYTQSSAPTYTTELRYDAFGTLDLALIRDGRPRRGPIRCSAPGRPCGA